MAKFLLNDDDKESVMSAFHCKMTRSCSHVGFVSTCAWSMREPRPSVDNSSKALEEIVKKARRAKAAESNEEEGEDSSDEGEDIDEEHVEGSTS